MTVFWDGLAALSYTRRHISQPGEKREAGVVLNTAMGRPADGAETSGPILVQTRGALVFSLKWQVGGSRSVPPPTLVWSSDVTGPPNVR